MDTQIWLCDLSYTQQGVSAEVMPAAMGGIAAWCEARCRHPVGFRLFKYPETLIHEMTEGVPRIVGFSNYSWNLELSHAFAQVFKQKHPEVIVVMGGPNYPLDPAGQEAFLRRYSAVDFYVFREGEMAFTALVEALIEHGFDVEKVKDLRLDSVHAVCGDGRFLSGDLAPRIRDLSGIPSPYITGRMDGFFDGKLMPILQTNRGCPFGCTYCNEGNEYHSHVFRHSQERIAAEIGYIGRKMAESRASGGRNDLFIADDNFGMYAEDLDTCRALARSRETHGWPEYITVATGKNKVHRVIEAARLLPGAMRLTGSVQSLDPDVLRNVHRSNVDSSHLIRLAEEAERLGANSHAEVILGLPGDSVEKHFKSVQMLIDAGFVEIRIYQLMLLAGAELSSSEVRRRFGLRTHFRVIPRSFGDYVVDPERRVMAAEIEEIVTAQDTLSFDEYLRCRRFALLVNVLYNDGVFGGILKLLRHLEISRFAWIQSVAEHPLPERLARQVYDFVRETREELWESEEDLLAFTRQPESIDRLLREELGSNLILKYRTLVLEEQLQELTDVARATVLDLIRQRGKLTAAVEALVRDLVTFELLSKVDLWRGDYAPHDAVLQHDVEEFLRSSDEVPLSKCRLPEPRRFRFLLTKEQIGVIERSLNAYGRNLAGRARISTRVHVKSLNRHAIPIQ